MLLAILFMLQAPAAQDFPAYAVRQLALLRDGAAPLAWLRANPTDSFTLFERRHELENHDRWCARAAQRATLAGTGVVRYAYFYPPDAPSDWSLPSGGDPIRDQCRLGTIWVETAVDDSVSGAGLAARTREALTRAYGAIRVDSSTWFMRRLASATDSSRRAALSRAPGFEAMRLGLSFFRSAFWRVVGRWQSNSAVIVSAFDRGGPRELRRPRVLAFAFLPFAELGAVTRIAESDSAADESASALAARAARLSGLDSLLARRLLAAHRAAHRSSQDGSGNAESTRLLVAALTDWIAASRPLDAPRRAAALLAADQVLGSNGAGYLLAQDDAGPARQAVTSLGARLANDQLGGGQTYMRSWLGEARGLDSLGRTSRLTTLALLRIGFNRGMCVDTEDASSRVSASAERLLQTPGDSVERTELHRLAGDGYSDIVALAAGVGREYADSAAYTGAAPEARRKAIAHYRRAIVLAPRAAETRDTWLKAWRLLAGLPPTTVHFFCVYD